MIIDCMIPFTWSSELFMFLYDDRSKDSDNMARGVDIKWKE